MTDPPDDVDADGDRVPLTDWSAVQDHLSRFVADGYLAERDDALACEFGGVTHFTVHRDGRVETAMPLHEFAAPDVEALVFDHARGTVCAVAGEGGVSYLFRRP